MKHYMTDDEMLKREQFFAIVCIGGLTEGFDYSAEKAKMKWWAEQRRQCGYRGGMVDDEQVQQH